MKVKVAILVMAFALLPLANALAEEPSDCDQLTGKAKGICIAATKGVKCGDLEPSATKPACDRLAAEFKEATGGAIDPPWVDQGACTPEWKKITQWLINNYDYKSIIPNCVLNEKSAWLIYGDLFWYEVIPPGSGGGSSSCIAASQKASVAYTELKVLEELVVDTIDELAAEATKLGYLSNDPYTKDICFDNRSKIIVP